MTTKAPTSAFDDDSDEMPGVSKRQKQGELTCELCAASSKDRSLPSSGKMEIAGIAALKKWFLVFLVDSDPLTLFQSLKLSYPCPCLRFEALKGL